MTVTVHSYATWADNLVPRQLPLEFRSHGQMTRFSCETYAAVQRMIISLRSHVQLARNQMPVRTMIRDVRNVPGSYRGYKGVTLIQANQRRISPVVPRIRV